MLSFFKKILQKPPETVIDYLDEQVLAKFKPELQQRLVSIFTKQVSETLPKLDVALKDNNLEEIYKLAHFLKGGCQGIGAIHMADICLDLQTAGEQQQLTQSDELVQQLKLSYEKTEQQLSPAKKN